MTFEPVREAFQAYGAVDPTYSAQLAVYVRGEAIARDRGIIVADTKVEFGFAGGGGIR